MFVTWEDRKNSGQINQIPMHEKPALSFQYAWFLLTDETAQYVVSHDSGCWNKDMTEEQKQEVIDFYTVQTTPKPEPSSELKMVVGDGISLDDEGRKIQVWKEVDRFQDIPGGLTKAEQETEFLAQQFENAKAGKQAQIDTLFQDQIKALRGTVLPEEVDTFLIQEREARAWTADNTADIPFVTSLAVARGLTVAELVPRILAKADYYTDLSATVMGNKHRLEDLLDRAATVEAVDAIVVE